MIMNKYHSHRTARATFATGLALVGLLGAAQAQTDNSVNNGVTVLQSRRIATGTTVKIALLQSLNSGTAQVGDRVRARVAAADTSGLPKDTPLLGRVTQVTPATSKGAGVVDVRWGIVGRDTANQPVGYEQSAAFTDQASAHLVGQGSSSEKSNYASIGAGAGAVIGLSRKRKLGDAIAGAILGGVGGYAADQAQKHPGTDVNLVKGSVVSIRLDTPLTLRTEVVTPY